MKHFKISFLLLSLLLSPPLYAVIVGSTESVSIQSNITFPAADNDNMMLGFAAFKNGFTLENASTTCIFNSEYPVSGPVNFNDGTLILEQDLVHKDLVAFGKLGTIIGNGNNWDLSRAVFNPIIPTGTLILQDVNVYLGSDFPLTNEVHILGACSIIGTGNILEAVEGLGFLTVESGSSLTLKNIAFTNLSGTNIQCVDDTGSVIFVNASISQSGDFSFSQGSLSFDETVNWGGPYVFTYDSTQSSTIQSESTLYLSQGITFSVGRFEDNAPVDPLVFVDQSSTLQMENATLNINEHGAQFLKGTFETTDNVTIDVSSTTTTQALFFGDGTLANDVLFKFDGGSSTDFQTGLVVWNLADFTIITARNGSAIVQQGPESIFMFQQNMQIDNITYSPDTLSTLIIAPGKVLALNNLTYVPAGGSFLVSGFYEAGFGFLLAGNQSLIINSGTLAVATLIANAGNTLGGAGTVGEPIILNDNNAQLIWNLTGKLDADIIMNGGSLSFANDLNMGHEIIFSGTGIVHINNNNINIGDLDTSWSDALYWDGSIGVINMNANVALSNTWTFSGTCIIDGGGGELDLLNGAFVIERGSTLILRNVLLYNISGTNVQCLDDAGVLIIEDSTWDQNGSYIFTLGALELQGAITMQGDANSIFSYQSDQPITFASDTSLTLDQGFTFSYDASSPDLLQFTDASSVLVLNSATLATNAQGLNLFHGSLQVQGNSLLSTSSFIALGDCFNGTNDFVINVQSNAQLAIESGNFNYKNVNASSWNMQNTSILYINGGASLNLYQVLNLGTGSAVFGNNATLGNEANLIGSSSQEGTLNFVTLPPC